MLSTINSERVYDIYAFDSFHIGPKECTLHAAPLRGFNGSLDDGLELSVDKVALAAVATLCADAVCAAGGGKLSADHMHDDLPIWRAMLRRCPHRRWPRPRLRGGSVLPIRFLTC